MLNSKEITNHHLYTDLKNYKKLMVISHFVMSSDLEEQYVEFLREMVSNLDSEWLDFKEEILEEIKLYEITPEDVNQAMSNFIKVKPLSVC